MSNGWVPQNGENMKGKVYNNCMDVQNSSGLWLRSYSYTDEDGVYCMNRCRAYNCWLSIKSRTSKTNKRASLKKFPITTTNGFKDFQEFAGWCQTQEGYRNKDSSGRYWALDKDLLIPGNKIYSPEACCFVPPRVNSVLPIPKYKDNNQPMGVIWRDKFNKFQAGSSYNGTHINLGMFQTAQEAHKAWQKLRYKVIQELSVDDELPQKVRDALTTLANRIQNDIILGIETVYER